MIKASLSLLLAGVLVALGAGTYVVIESHRENAREIRSLVSRSHALEGKVAELLEERRRVEESIALPSQSAEHHRGGRR